MNYTEEDKEDKKYKKGYSKKEFKKDVQEAVKPVVENLKKKKAVKAPTKRAAYANMSAAQLRKFLVDKKKKLLMKSGFPEGGIPRSKADMINLCMRLKRKRW